MAASAMAITLAATGSAARPAGQRYAGSFRGLFTFGGAAVARFARQFTPMGGPEAGLGFFVVDNDAWWA